MKELETLNKQNFEDLIKGKKSFLSSLDTLPKAIFSGSFDPLHQGHKSMHDHARKVLNTDIFFEVVQASTNFFSPETVITSPSIASSCNIILSHTV